MTVLTISGTHIRPAQPAEHTALVMLWEHSVLATHDSLTEADIVFHRPLVGEYFERAAVELWALTGEANVPVGFLGLDGNAVAALFVEPDRRRREARGRRRRASSGATPMVRAAIAI